MADEVARNLIARYETLFNDQTTYRAHCQEVADYFLPRKANIIRRRQPGARQTEKLFDGTGGRAGTRLAANLHGSLTSSAIQWFSWVMERDELNKEPAIAQWTEASTQTGYKKFHSPLTNFAPQMHETYIDLVHFGMAALLFEAVTEEGGKLKQFIFRTLQIGTYVIDENIFGRVDTLIRRFDMSVRNAIARFKFASLPKEVTQKADKEPDAKFPFIHAVMPIEDYERMGGKLNGVTLPFVSVYTSLKGEKRILEEGYRTFPYMVPRWSKTSGEVTGRSPAMEALPDNKTLNKGQEYKLDALAYTLRPPILVEDDGVIGDVDMAPGSYTVFRRGAEIKPLFSGSDLRVGEVELELLKKGIQESFFYDDLNLPQGRQMTAEEVIQRIEILQRLLGPTLGRLEAELLNPLTERAWDLLFHAGEFPPAPKELSKRDIAVRYEGPLARAQRSIQVEAMLKTRSVADRIAASGQVEVYDNMDVDEEFRLAADILGYPKKALRDQQTIDQIREQRAEQAAARSIASEGPALARGMKDMAQAAMVGQGNGKNLVPGAVAG